ncbi:hypothetical protein DSM104443_00280 [Usitatibacter rugosus]|uniref:Lipoprotein n=1 Tax=Usitatibacter rugosus TaxID=2732067 RepID=A0A6M4GSG0_9PROT|nr:hypothetical protein [Usitatibacter rugosus]QJR09243.1 hypothetical protein DSM104443_00280 [Usitatibacter rugosus]
MNLNGRKVRRTSGWLCFTLLLIVSGCATYQTPGAGVNVGNLSKADEDIAELMKREPAAPFPARMAMVRVQASGYYSRNNQCYGKGQFCVVTTRDIETEKDIERLTRLPMVADVAPLSRILLSSDLKSTKDLRLAAATLKTDLLLVYSIDTRFTVESNEIGPLGLISLGFLPNKKAHVTTTASAALFDVRTGFVFGAAEATVTEQQRATFWSSEDAIESVRLKTEAEAFQKLLGEFEKLWKGVVERHAATKR